MPLPRYAYFRGHIVPYSEARVGVLTHALNYGTACFAGVRAYWNEEEEELFVFRPRDHFRRFLDSARLLGMELPDTARQLQRGARRADAGRAPPRGLLRAPARVLRRRVGGRPAPQSEARGLDGGLPVWPLSRQRRQPASHDLVVAPRGRQHDPRPRQDRRRLRQLGARQERRAARRLRRRDPPDTGRARLGELGRERLPRAQRRRHHARGSPTTSSRESRGARSSSSPRRRWGSRSSSGRWTGRRSSSPTRCSSAAPACRSGRSRGSTTARSARAAWAPS